MQRLLKSLPPARRHLSLPFEADFKFKFKFKFELVPPRIQGEAGAMSRQIRDPVRVAT